jgi:hypothetical protein
MSGPGKFAVAVSVVWCVGFTVIYARLTPLLGLLSLPLGGVFFLAILVSMVCVFTEWRRRRWRSMLPFVVCVTAFFLERELVRVAHDILFAWSLPSYEAVVNQMESGRIPVSVGFSRIPQAEPQARLVWRVYAEKGPNGALMVEFDTERGFPVLHGGLLYSSSGAIEPGSRMDSRWPRRRQTRIRWFFVSN